MFKNFLRRVYYYFVNLYLHFHIPADSSIIFVVPFSSLGGLKDLKKRITVKKITRKPPLYTQHLNCHVILEEGSHLHGGILELGQGSQVYLTKSSSLVFGDVFSVGDFSMIVVSGGSTLKVLDNFHVMNFFRLSCDHSVVIGKNFLGSDFVTIRDNDGHPLEFEDGSKNHSKPVIIGDRVWVGIHSTILKGASLGNMVVVGANSLVTKKVPDNYVVAGNPLRQLKKIKKWERFYD